MNLHHIKKQKRPPLKTNWLVTPPKRSPGEFHRPFWVPAVENSTFHKRHSESIETSTFYIPKSLLFHFHCFKPIHPLQDPFCLSPPPLHFSTFPSIPTVDGQINQTPNASAVSSPGPPEFQCYCFTSPGQSSGVSFISSIRSHA